MYSEHGKRRPEGRLSDMNNVYTDNLYFLYNQEFPKS